MRHLFFALIFALGIAAGPSRADDKTAKAEKLREIPNLTANERIALYKECWEMQHWAVNGMLMSKWGPMVVKINPSLVMSHLANVKIIINNTDKVESGFYVTLPISSYIPDPKDFSNLTLLSLPGDKTDGDIYVYRINKKK